MEPVQIVDSIKRMFSHRVLEADVFRWDQTEIHEMVLEEIDSKKRKIIWARTPSDEPAIDGKRNPLIYLAYKDKKHTAQARIRVAEAFARYHGIK